MGSLTPQMIKEVSVALRNGSVIIARQLHNNVSQPFRLGHYL